MNDISIKLLYHEPSLHTLLADWAYNYWFIYRGIEKYKVILDYKRRVSMKMPMSWISYYENVPCGMVSLKEKEIAPGLNLSPWLSALYVEPEFRNRGIAAKLINSVLDFARDMEYSIIYLFTDYKNAEYLSGYYTRKGWVYVCDSEDSFGKEVKIYSKNLK